jgi:hypothetical protein
MPLILLPGCSAGADDQVESGAETPPPAGVSRTPKDGFDRESFVLCPALEAHRDELAAIVGFEQDAERPIALSDSECSIDGESGAFARVTLAPAFEPSVEFHVRGFDAPNSPAPALGPNAVFVDVNLQPHVVFAMGSLIIDVDAAGVETPSRDTMIELAKRVREILRNANG